MGILNTIKSKVGGNKRQIKQGVDKAADVIEGKAGAHADKVNKGAEAVKKAVDKIPDA